MATTKTPFATLDTSAHANETKEPSLRRTRSTLVDGSLKDWGTNNFEPITKIGIPEIENDGDWSKRKVWLDDNGESEWVDGKDLYKHATADELQDGDTIAALEEEGETDNEEDSDDEEEEKKEEHKQNRNEPSEEHVRFLHLQKGLLGVFYQGEHIVKYNEEKHELIAKLLVERFDDIVKRFDTLDSKLDKVITVVMGNDGALRVRAGAVTDVHKQNYNNNNNNNNNKNARNNRAFSKHPPLPHLVAESSSSAIP